MLQLEWRVPRLVHLKLLSKLVAIKMRGWMVVHNDPELWEALN